MYWHGRRMLWPQSAEILTLLNFGRLTFGFTLGFYMTPFAKAASYGTAWIVMAVISVALYAGIFALIMRSRVWRERLITPNFDRDLVIGISLSTAIAMECQF